MSDDNGDAVDAVMAAADDLAAVFEAGPPSGYLHKNWAELYEADIAKARAAVRAAVERLRVDEVKRIPCTHGIEEGDEAGWDCRRDLPHLPCYKHDRLIELARQRGGAG